MNKINDLRQTDLASEKTANWDRFAWSEHTTGLLSNARKEVSIQGATLCLYTPKATDV